MKSTLIFAVLFATASAEKLNQQSVHSLNDKDTLLQTGSSMKFEEDGSDMPRAQYTMVKNMASDLGVPLTPELMQLTSNEEISAKIVEIALGMGKSEEEISAALGADGKDM